MLRGDDALSPCHFYLSTAYVGVFKYAYVGSMWGGAGMGGRADATTYSNSNEQLYITTYRIVLTGLYYYPPPPFPPSLHIHHSSSF